MQFLQKILFFLVLGLFSLPAYTQNEPGEFYDEFTIELKADYRYFPKNGTYPGQLQHYPGLVAQPEFYLEWPDGNKFFQFTLFGRLDRDGQRTHWDVRELYYTWIKGNSEFSVGAKKIFWGVTESVHLVDIINQTDFVESFDGEQKLGQPMAHFSTVTDLGTFDVFAMPYFRKRQFPGMEGRLRTPFVLEKDDLTFESDSEEWHPDFAVNWSHYIGSLDFGASYFYGNGREPIFQFNSENGDLNVFYPLIHQVGLTAQAITGAWIWKAESIVRRNEFQNIFALAAGFEYTFSNVKNSGLDIGILGEYLYDSRDEFALSGLDNDIFVGSRLAFNDVQSSEILVGGIFDLDKSTRLFSVEASRRFGQSWKVSLEGRFFVNADEDEFLYLLSDDSFIQLGVSKFF